MLNRHFSHLVPLDRSVSRAQSQLFRVILKSEPSILVWEIAYLAYRFFRIGRLFETQLLPKLTAETWYTYRRD